MITGNNNSLHSLNTERIAFLAGYMDKTARRKRDYKAEYARYHGSAEQIARRAARNKSRRKALALGLVALGDGMDVDHIDGNPLNMDDKNLRAMAIKDNRSRKHNTEKLKEMLAEADRQGIVIPKGLTVLKQREFLKKNLKKDHNRG